MIGTLSPVTSPVYDHHIDIRLSDPGSVRGVVRNGDRTESFEGWLTLLAALERVIERGRNGRPANERESWG